MPNQPDIQQRIAEALTKDLQCSADDGALHLADELAEELAQWLVSELGLAAEWALTSGGGRQTVMSERAAKDKAQRWPESFGVASRYVTKWQDQ